MRFPGFIGPSYVSQSVNVDCQRCVNLYPELDDLGTGKEREVASLVSTPGLRLLLTLAGGTTRGGFTASNGTLYAVAGNKLYSISNAYVATELGSLSTSTGPVSIADNGLQLVVVDGQYGYSYTFGTSTFAQITDPDFQGADQVTYQDGYFIFNKAGSGQFFISGLNTLTIDPLDFATAEGSPDNVVGVISSQQKLFVLGTQSTEIFYDSGDADFPFARMQGAVSDVGCAAAFSIAKIGDAVYFIGGDENGQGIVYRMAGLQAQRISNSAVESVIRSITVTQLASARAWTYQDGGHQFYCLNLPGVNATWVFDASTSFWHERTYRNLWNLERHRADWHAKAYGGHVVGDYANGNIYALEQTVYTDEVTDNAPTPIVRMRRAPHLSKDGNNIFISRFQLDMETGVGLDGTQQGTDPKVILRVSKDGGHTWSDEREASIGKIGQTKTRAIWRRLGRVRDCVFELTVSDPVKVVLIGADLLMEEGAA